MKGVFERCLHLVDKAKNCGVDAIKFQTFDPELFYERNKKKKTHSIKKFSLTRQELLKVKKSIVIKKKSIFLYTI